MLSTRPVSFGLSMGFVVILSVVGIVQAEDLNIPSGTAHTISDLLSLDTEKYDNEGVLSILAGGELSIGSGVQNSTPLSEGLDLGNVINLGIIDAAQTIRFREDSLLSGEVTSSEKVIFDGQVHIDGKILAQMIVFNSGSGASTVDLEAGAELDTDHLVVNGQLKVLADGGTFTLNTLELSQPGAILEADADIIIEGNYVAASSSGLASKMDGYGDAHGNITLKGGGGILDEFSEYGEFNNFLAGTVRAKTLTVQNKSYIAAQFTVRGDLVLDGNSYTETAELLIVDETLRLKEGAVLKLDDAIIDLYGYNGAFYGGFDLAADSHLTSTTDDGALSLAIGADSVIGANAMISAENLLLAGISGAVPYLTNAGTIQSDMLHLYSADLLNQNDGTIDIGKQLVLEKSSLDLTGSSAENGGLKFSGNDKKLIYIDSDSQLQADTLSFAGINIDIVNQNYEKGGGIVATNFRLGSGATLSGGGAVYADTVFESGATLNLGISPTNFSNKSVTFESGSIIVMGIDPEGYNGMVLALDGTITIDPGVLLKIDGDSNFDTLTGRFVVAAGGIGSEFSEELRLVDTPFFTLADVLVWEDDEYDRLLLLVDIVKAADLGDYAGSRNQRAFSLMIERLQENGKASEAQQRVFNSLMWDVGTEAEFSRALGSLVGDIRANGLLVALSQPWRIPLERSGMERLALDVPRRGRTASLSPTESEYFGQSPNIFSCNIWLDTHYNHTRLRTDNNASGGLGDRYGVNLGVEWTPTYETLFGWTFGYGNGSFTQDNGHLRINDYQFGLYGGANFFNRNFQLRGYVGYGHLDFTQDRRVRIGDTHYTAHGSTPGDSVSASLMLIRPADISDRFLFKPAFGIDFERISQAGFREYGSPGIVLSYNGTDFQRLMLRLGASGEHSLQRGSIWGRFFYGVKVAGDSVAMSRTQFVGTTEPGVVIRSVNVGDSVFDVGIGGKHLLNAARTVWIFADYNGSFAKRSDSHTGSIGFAWKR